MANQGPCYGLSRTCQMKAFAKFDMEKAMTCLQWIQELTNMKLEPPNPIHGFRDQIDFSAALVNGVALCTLMNVLEPNSIKTINKSAAPFKQRENIEMFIKACDKYGLKSHDLFQVNDLYEKKNPYMIVNCLYALGGLAKKKGFEGPTIGVKVANENVREFPKEILQKSNAVIGLQSGTNRGASQAGMTAYGTGRQIKPDEMHY